MPAEKRLDVDKLRRLVNQRMTCAKIAEIFGCSVPTVRKYVALYNLDWHPLSSGPKSIPMPNLRELVKQGWRLSKLAKKYGCYPQTVWDRIQKLGIPYNWNRGSPGAMNGSWKGGRIVDKDGYVLIWTPKHPFANNHSRVREHRLVMEKKLGRYLTPKEVVHHKDDNRSNNAIDNLELYSSNAEHLRDTISGQVPNWAEDGKRRISEGVRRARGRHKKPIREKSKKDDVQ